MNVAAIAIVAENAVILAAIAARWSLLRQGGGLQEKTPPVPKAPPQPKGETQAKAPPAPEASTDPLPKVSAVA